MIGSPDTETSGKWLFKMLVLAAVYYVAARVGLMLAYESSNASPVWPPSGIAFAALLVWGARCWPGVFVGALAANIAVFSANHVAGITTIGLVSTSIAAGNTLEALVGVYLLRRMVGAGGYLYLSGNIYKFVFCCILAAAAGAVVGTGSLIAGGIVPSAARWSISSIWWLGDASGILVVAPFLLSWGNSAEWRRPATDYLLAAVALALLGAGLWLVFGQHFSSSLGERWTAYLILPILGFAAYRFQQRGVTLVLVIATGAAVVASTRGYGPFATGTLLDSLMTLELFIGLCSVVGLVLAADISQRLRRDAAFSWRSQPWAMLNWPSLFLCLGLTVVAWHLIASSTQRQAEERFKYIAETVKRRIDERMDVYENLLHAGQGLFAASHDVERGEWQQFVQHLKIERDFPGVMGIGYGQLVLPSQVDDLIRQAETGGVPDFKLWPAGERDAYVPVLYLEPEAGANRQVLGFDMFSEALRKETMLKARDSGEAAITHKLILVQNMSDDTQAGFIMYAPVYRNGMPIATRSERIAALEGYVYSPFRMRDLMTGILGNSVPEVAVRIYDGSEASDASLMYVSDNFIPSDPNYPNPFAAFKTISAVNDETNWSMRITSLPYFETTVDRQKSLIVLIAGTVISLLFFGIVTNLAKTRETAEALAEEMVAALRQSNLSLRQSEERFRLLTSKVKDYAILLLDADGLVLTWNEGAERLNGYKEDEVIGRSFQTFYMQEDIAAGKPQSAIRQARESGQFESSGWHVRKDGTRYFADTLITALHDAGGEFVGFAKITRDITQEKRTEQDLHLAIEQAESASRAKSEFVANMSHELRTPMNAVLGMTYLLGNSALNQEQRKYLDMIRASGQSLLDILNDILDFSKIEAGRMELSPSEFRLGDVLDALATIMSVNSGDKDLELIIEVAPETPDLLVGDALRVQQVLINLVGNAIKFTERGAVSVSVRCAECGDDVANLEFRVNDSGIGMTAEQQARLFSPFTQADSSMTRRFGGSGLGLTICRRLADLMGGQISLTSELGVGSEFRAVLPLKKARPLEDRKRPRNAMPALQLLVVDDNQASRDAIRQTVQNLGWQAETAGSSSAACDAMRRALREGRRFDAVLVDWRMPDMNGGAAVDAIRALPIDTAMPMVFITNAHGRNELTSFGMASKVDQVLAKPITAYGLYDAMAELLVHRPREARHLTSLSKPAVEHVLAGARILLAEDNVMNQIVAKGMLEQAGAKVDIVENGQMAVDLLRITPQRYDLILMDVQMPVMDGFTATRLIRSWAGSAIPVLAMTAGVTESERMQCTEAGMDDFIAKPIDLSQMFAAILRHLPNRMPSVAPNVVLSPGPLPLPVAAAPAEEAPVRENAAAVLDMGQLMELAASNPAYEKSIIEMVQSVMDKGLAPMREARQAWVAGDGKTCARILHRLRGEIGNLGAERFVAASQACEQAIQGADGDLVPSLLARVESELEQALEKAGEWLQGRRDANAADEPAAVAVDREAFEDWKLMLVAHDIDACSRFREVRPRLAQLLPPEQLAALDGMIANLDFDAVVERLQHVSADFFDA